jgi:hypothetical protein
MKRTFMEEENRTDEESKKAAEAGILTEHEFIEVE